MRTWRVTMLFVGLTVVCRDAHILGQEKDSRGLVRGYIEVPQAETEDPKVQLVSQFRLIELDVAKMRGMGFELTAGGDTRDVRSGIRVLGATQQDQDAMVKVLETMVETGLARTVAEPTLATVSGRRATFAIRPNKVQLRYLPHFISEKRIRTEIWLAIDKRRDFVGATFESEPGRSTLLLVTADALRLADDAASDKLQVLIVRTRVVSPVAKAQSPDAATR